MILWELNQTAFRILRKFRSILPVTQKTKIQEHIKEQCPWLQKAWFPMEDLLRRTRIKHQKNWKSLSLTKPKPPVRNQALPRKIFPLAKQEKKKKIIEGKWGYLNRSKREIWVEFRIWTRKLTSKEWVYYT